jgi:hypothetical protein
MRGSKSESMAPVQRIFFDTNALDQGWPILSVRVQNILTAAAKLGIAIAVPDPYHSRCEVTGTVLRYTRSYQINALRVPVEQWDELLTFHSRIARDERTNAVLKQKAH